VKVVSPYPPGGTVDILARIISGWLQEKLGSRSWSKTRRAGA